MRFQGLPIDALPLFPGLPPGVAHLYQCVGLSTVQLW
jgi:hypothetical protein